MRILALLLFLPGCACVFPPEVDTIDKIVNSRYVTDEQRGALRDLNTGPLGKAIEEARDR